MTKCRLKRDTSEEKRREEKMVLAVVLMLAKDTGRCAKMPESNISIDCLQSDCSAQKDKLIQYLLWLSRQHYSRCAQVLRFWDTRILLLAPRYNYLMSSDVIRVFFWSGMSPYTLSAVMVILHDMRISGWSFPALWSALIINKRIAEYTGTVAVLTSDLCNLCMHHNSSPSDR